jgi:spore photoproduct lyase
MGMIERIVVTREAAARPRTERIISGFPHAAVVYEGEAGAGFFPGGETPDKRTLKLDVFNGPFIKRCPCSKGAFTCGYYVLSPVVGCPHHCSYCVLREYLNAGAITAYVNLEDMFVEVDGFLAQRPGVNFRIGTGELADSLALEPGLGFAREMVEFFSDKENVLFELKTKSRGLDALAGVTHGGRTVIGFSLNPNIVAESEEPDAAPLSERMEAAALAVEAGYRVAFHFDPVIDLDPPAGPDRSSRPYREVIDTIYTKVPADSIAWISLGALRFNKKLYRSIREENPGAKIMLGEFTEGFDRKMRYLRHRRRGLLSNVASMIRAYDPGAPVYVCMEDVRMVERVLGTRSLPF